MAVESTNTDSHVAPLPLGLTGREHLRLADVLIQATRDYRQLESLQQQYPELTIGDADRIRDAILARRLADGERVVGARVAIHRTARSDFSIVHARLTCITTGMLLEHGRLDVGLTEVRLEPRIAFWLKRPLDGRVVPTMEELLDATERIAPCVEAFVAQAPPPFGASPAEELAYDCASLGLLSGIAVPPLSTTDMLRLTARHEPGPHAWAVADAGPSPLGRRVRLTRESRLPPAALDRGAVLVAPVEGDSLRLRPGEAARLRFAHVGVLEIGSTVGNLLSTKTRVEDAPAMPKAAQASELA